MTCSVRRRTLAGEMGTADPCTGDELAGGRAPVRGRKVLLYSDLKVRPTT